MDNFPEINLPSRKKKGRKGGFIPWLRNTLGMGGSGSALGTAGAGGGTFLGSTFLGGLLVGKGALVATMAITALAVGAGLIVSNYGSDKSKTSGAFDSAGVKQSASGGASGRYTPAILRARQQDGSSLDMFKGANVGAFDYEEEEAESSDQQEEGTADASAEAPQVPDQTDMAEQLVGRLIGGGLSTELGGGSDRFSGFGGFGNRFGDGMFGSKIEFNDGLSLMKESPSFSARKKLLAMKARSRTIVPRRKTSRRPGLKGALAQATGIKGDIGYTGTDIDSAKSTQDEAWEGTVGEGDAGVPAGGEGISSGGAGLVTSPSIDNTQTPIGGGDIPEQEIPDYTDTTPQDVSPWASAVSMAMMLILASAALSAIGAKLILAGNTPATAWMKVLGMILCYIALGLALYAVTLGIQVMSQHGQAILGTIYTIGGGVAAVAAIAAMTGKAPLGISAMWWAAIAGIIALLGSMMGGMGGQ